MSINKELETFNDIVKSHSIFRINIHLTAVFKRILSLMLRHLVDRIYIITNCKWINKGKHNIISI